MPDKPAGARLVHRIFCIPLIGLAALASHGSCGAQASYPARQRQAIASMKTIWESFLAALEKGDVARAQTFVIPEGRAAFAENALTPALATRVRAVSSKMACNLESDIYGTCSFTLPTNAGAGEEITISFLSRDGVWYIHE